MAPYTAYLARRAELAIFNMVCLSGMHALRTHDPRWEERHSEWREMLSVTQVAAGQAGTPPTTLSVDEFFLRHLTYREIMTCWASVELLVFDVLRLAIAEDHTILQRSPLTRIRVAPGDLMTLSREQQYDLLTQEAVRTLQNGSGKGLDRPAAVFRFLGLNPALDHAEIRGGRELAALRHLIAHRQGVVDDRFQAEVSGYGATLGEPVMIRPSHAHDLLACVDRYVAKLAELSAERNKVEAAGQRLAAALRQIASMHRPDEIGDYPVGDRTH